MGKWTDKLYITQQEWTSEFGGAKKRATPIFKPLSHDICALTFAPFSDPVCSPDGYVFDLPAISAYLEIHGKNPATGKPLSQHDLLQLRYSKTGSGEYHCPVTLKVFTDFSKIVVNKRSGQVYSAEGVEKLKTTSGERMMDFYTDEPFSKNDILVLQDPEKLKNLQDFEHVKGSILNKDDPSLVASTITAEGTSGKIVNGLPRLPTYSQGKVASSLTSSTFPVEVRESPLEFNEQAVMFKSIKKPGKAVIITNLGDLQIELYCHKVPKTCFNFIELSKQGYYEGVKFHRLIPGFVIQGGDRDGDGRGGRSIWGEPFENESAQGLTHNARGILSMANKSGIKSNTSQFFITFQPCHSLDGNHPVFGKVIGGWETLDAMEVIPTDKKTNLPLNAVIIKDIVIVEDPFAEYLKGFQRSQHKRKANTDPSLIVKRAKSAVNTPLTIGKYIKR